MATPAAPAAPAAPPRYTLLQQLLFTRQMLRFYESPAVPPSLKATVPRSYLLEARFILDQGRACSRFDQPEEFKVTRTEADFPPSWLQYAPNDLRLLWQRFRDFASSGSMAVPTWLPSKVITGQGLNRTWAVEVFPPTGNNQYAGDSPHRRFTLKVVDIAYSLISTQKSKDALREILREIVADWTRLHETHLYRDDEDNDLRAFQAIEGFITKLRDSFPRVTLERNSDLGGSDAQTTRRRWHQPGQTMQDFDPRRACAISLNFLVCC